jgi:hypothetical protein
VRQAPVWKKVDEAFWEKIPDGQRRQRNGGEKLLREMNRFPFVAKN